MTDKEPFFLPLAMRVREPKQPHSPLSAAYSAPILKKISQFQESREQIEGSKWVHSYHHKHTTTSVNIIEVYSECHVETPEQVGGVGCLVGKGK